MRVANPEVPAQLLQAQANLALAVLLSWYWYGSLLLSLVVAGGAAWVMITNC